MYNPLTNVPTTVHEVPESEIRLGGTHPTARITRTVTYRSKYYGNRAVTRTIEVISTLPNPRAHA